MAQPTDTKHKPSPNITGGVNDIYLPEVPKMSVGNSNIYLQDAPKIAGGANDIYLKENTPTASSGIYLEDNKPV